MKLQRFCLAVRRITVAPANASVMLLVAYLVKPEIFCGPLELILGLCFLGLLPCLAYPVQRLVPKLRAGGRDEQRSLAMYFAAIGYILGLVAGILSHATDEIIVIYSSYLISGLLILAVNKLFKFKVSGHACGIVGPSALLLYLRIYPAAAVGFLLTAFVYMASIETKRHTPLQFAMGGIIPFAAIPIALLFV